MLRDDVVVLRFAPKGLCICFHSYRVRERNRNREEKRREEKRREEKRKERKRNMKRREEMVRESGQIQKERELESWG